MAPETVDYAKGESPMTDFQFTAYLELREKYESLLQEVVELRLVPISNSESGVSDYQFQRFEEIRDKNEELNNELAVMRKENTRLKMQVELLKTSYGVNRF